MGNQGRLGRREIPDGRDVMRCSGTSDRALARFGRSAELDEEGVEGVM
jgi:hypothetical protein